MPEHRFRQHTNTIVELGNLTDLFKHLADIHQILFGDLKKEQVIQNFDKTKPQRQLQTSKKATPRQASGTDSGTQKTGDRFRNFTQSCIKRPRESQKAGKSQCKVETPDREHMTTDIVNGGQCVGQHFLGGNVLDAAEIQPDFQDDYAVPVSQKSPVDEDVYTIHQPRRSARISALIALPPSQSPMTTSVHHERNRYLHPTALVASRSPANQRERAAPSRPPVVKPYHCTKKQANITIEIPPRPVDWKDGPLVDKSPTRTSASQRARSFQSVKDRPKKRPRGRPRRVPPNSCMDERTFRQQSQLVRKRKNFCRQSSIERELVNTSANFGHLQHATSLTSASPKRVCVGSER
ncbi:hypothetical protein MMC13_000200 [Lambiella insularis]|nr:hypothetical protein [Lambiella insularis]